MNVKGARELIAAAFGRWMGLATEAHILFPVIGVVLLAVIWGTTLNLIKVERAAAERTALVLAHELGETYEAQVIRALREIDQTLKVVQFAHERSDDHDVLQQLKVRDLLPPDLLFTLSITDSLGDVVASTHPLTPQNVAGQDFFQDEIKTDVFSVGRPRRDPESGAWRLDFSRRLEAADGSFAGIVMESVDSDFFVSGYESSKLGEHGLLGILGTDGVFKVRRSGETISSGDVINYAALMPKGDEADRDTALSRDVFDGVPRYTSTHRLYKLPLDVIVGLSAEEQLAPTRRLMQTHLLQASGGSLLLILVLGALGGMSRQLALSRKRVAEEQIAHAKRIEYLAYHDALTALPNRSLYGKFLEKSISLARRNEQQLAVLFLDLDRFKHINDTLGHEAGDQLLKEVATRLQSCLRDSDTVARLGGDEFVAVLPDIGDEKDVAIVSQKILTAVSRPIMLVGQEFRVTASIGICVYPRDGLDELTLTKNADIAMYRAKEEGKNIFQFFSNKLNDGASDRIKLESGLRHALEFNEFRLHYQVRRDVRNGRITGMEALLRWQHPELGTVAPMHFIPIAEETGLIIPMGRWVLRTACLQNVAWQRQGLPRLRMSVNLTARQFSDDGLLADLTSILADTGMDAQWLELEFNESVLMAHVGHTLRILSALRDKGIRIAIDDFGIGYLSLSKLKQFPLDTIKIDRSFIRDVANVAEDRDLTESIIAMGRTLSLTVVAQGVETKEQADFLRQNVCDELQGFYLNKPLPADRIEELLLTQLESPLDSSDSATPS